MTDEGKFHPDTKSCDYGEFSDEEPARRQCFVNTKDSYKDEKADGYIYVPIVQIIKKHRREGKDEGN